MNAKRRAARCLFGRPDENLTETLSQEVDAMHAEERERYGFDFANEVPIESSSASYQFEAVPLTNIPPAYHPRHPRSQKRVASSGEPSTSTAYGTVEEKPTKREKKESSIDPNYEKPVTRSSSRLSMEKGRKPPKKNLKQTKLTNYLPVRKRHRSPASNSNESAKRRSLRSRSGTPQFATEGDALPNTGSGTSSPRRMSTRRVAAAARSRRMASGDN